MHCHPKKGAIMSNLLLYVPEHLRGVAAVCLICAAIGMPSAIIFSLMQKGIRDALRKHTKLSEDDIEIYSMLYAMPYSFFWLYYPIEFIRFIIRKWKERKKHG